MSIDDLGSFITSHYELHEWRHATAVVRGEFPAEWADLLYVLTSFRLFKSDIATRGGNKSRIAKRIDGLFQDRGRQERKFDVDIKVDEISHPSPTHSVDNYKNGVAQETEWNNKDPFYDRDLNNFRLLHQLGVVSVGIIITRSDELQAIFNSLGRKGSYGESTTHMSKLLPRVEGGAAGGCPVLAIGITKALYESNR